MISDKTIEQLQQAVKTEILVDHAGREYVNRPVHHLPRDPEPKPLSVSTLMALVDYLVATDAKPEGTTVGFVHVVNHCHVQLVSPLYGVAQRDVFAEAKIPLCNFPFGTFTDHETFIISLQTQFQQSGERDRLITMFARLGGHEVRESEDDGITQSVTIKSGIVRNTEVAVPNPVQLKPYLKRRWRDEDVPDRRLDEQPVPEEGETPEGVERALASGP